VPVVFWIFLVRLSFFELFGVVLEDDGVCKSDFKIYLPIGFDILGIHCRPFKKYHYSDPVRTNACAVYDPVCCLFAVARVGLGGPNLVRTSRDIARGSRRAFKFTHIFTPRSCGTYDTIYPRCVFAFAGANSGVKRAVPLWVQHLALGMCTLCYPRCALVFSCSNLLKYSTILRFPTVCAKNPMKSSSSEKVPAKRVSMVF